MGCVRDVRLLKHCLNIQPDTEPGELDQLQMREMMSALFLVACLLLSLLLCVVVVNVVAAIVASR